MTNLEKYKQAFAEAFEIEPEEAIAFVYKATERWDSIGHMALIASLEDQFEIEFEPDEILAIQSFESGKEILRKKNIDI